MYSLCIYIYLCVCIYNIEFLFISSTHKIFTVINNMLVPHKNPNNFEKINHTG